MPKSTFDRQSLSRAKCFVEEVSLYSLQKSVRHQKVRTLYEVRHLLLCSAFPLLCPSQVRLAPPTADHAAEKKELRGQDVLRQIFGCTAPCQARSFFYLHFTYLVTCEPRLRPSSQMLGRSAEQHESSHISPASKGPHDSKAAASDMIAACGHSFSNNEP